MIYVFVIDGKIKYVSICEASEWDWGAAESLLRLTSSWICVCVCVCVCVCLFRAAEQLWMEHLSTDKDAQHGWMYSKGRAELFMMDRQTDTHKHIHEYRPVFFSLSEHEELFAISSFPVFPPCFTRVITQTHQFPHWFSVTLNMNVVCRH